jgi:cytochrome P450
VKESLRVRPVIHDVARRLTEPFQVGTWHLPAGVVVIPSIGLLHADDRNHAEAAAFRPERWLEEGSDTSPYAWIPFGGGTRRCLGATFATTEMATVLRTVLQEVELRAAEPAGEPQKMSHITIVPRDGARVVAS